MTRQPAETKVRESKTWCSPRLKSMGVAGKRLKREISSANKMINLERKPAVDEMPEGSGLLGMGYRVTEGMGKETDWKRTVKSLCSALVSFCLSTLSLVPLKRV